MLEGYSSSYFNRKEVTIFLKTLNRYYKDYRIDDDDEKKERSAKYVALRYSGSRPGFILGLRLSPFL